MLAACKDCRGAGKESNTVFKLDLFSYKYNPSEHEGRRQIDSLGLPSLIFVIESKSQTKLWTVYMLQVILLLRLPN